MHSSTFWSLFIFVASVFAVPGYHPFFHHGAPQSSPNFGPPSFHRPRPNPPFYGHPPFYHGGGGGWGGGYDGKPPGSNGPKQVSGTGSPPKKLPLHHGVREKVKCYPEEQSYCCSKQRGYGPNAVTIYSCMPTKKSRPCLYGERYGYCCDIKGGRQGKKHAPDVTATCSGTKSICQIENASRCHYPLPHPTQSG